MNAVLGLSFLAACITGIICEALVSQMIIGPYWTVPAALLVMAVVAEIGSKMIKEKKND